MRDEATPRRPDALPGCPQYAPELWFGRVARGSIRVQKVQPVSQLRDYCQTSSRYRPPATCNVNRTDARKASESITIVARLVDDVAAAGCARGVTAGAGGDRNGCADDPARSGPRRGRWTCSGFRTVRTRDASGTVLVDDDGRPRAAVIDYGGALGIGRRKVAVAWQVLHVAPEDPTHPIHLSLTRQQLGAIPEFKYGSGPTALGNGR